LDEDIKEVSYFITKVLQISPKNVILYIYISCRFGQSIGSIPTIKIAVNSKYDWLAVILVSPFSGGFCFSKRMTECVEDLDDPCSFLIMYVKCPLFIVHGIKDQVIPYKYSLQMAKRLKNVYQWYPRKADHHNLIINYRSKLFAKLLLFIENVMNKKSFNTSTASSLLVKYLYKENPFKLVKEESNIFNHYTHLLMKSYYSKRETNLMQRKTGNETISTNNNKNSTSYLNDDNSSYLIELNHLKNTCDN
jgi:hypothetical protein